jgi:hypothetical protein
VAVCCPGGGTRPPLHRADFSVDDPHIEPSPARFSGPGEGANHTLLVEVKSVVFVETDLPRGGEGGRGEDGEDGDMHCFCILSQLVLFRKGMIDCEYQSQAGTTSSL